MGQSASVKPTEHSALSNQHSAKTEMAGLRGSGPRLNPAVTFASFAPAIAGATSAEAAAPAPGRCDMETSTKPSVLFVYYTYTKQTLKVVETMAGVFRDRGCEVALAVIEFIDPRYADRFKEFPMPHPYREVFGMILPELRHTVGQIRIPAVVTEREYDFVCIASPTWWLSTNVPIRSFLESETAARVLKGKRFAVAAICRRYWRHNMNTVRRLATERGGVFVDVFIFVMKADKCARCCRCAVTSDQGSAATATWG